MGLVLPCIFGKRAEKIRSVKMNKEIETTIWFVLTFILTSIGSWLVLGLLALSQ